LLKIIDFIEDHAEQALSITKDNYEKERKSVPILPEFVEFPDFSVFIKMGLAYRHLMKTEWLVIYAVL